MNRAVFMIIFFVASISSEIVEIENGKIRGNTFLTRAGHTLFVFNRIPYATPPLDKLRFQAPQPIKNWDGVFDATQGVVSCYQTAQMRGDIPMTEDCLHINVFTRNLTNVKPVLVSKTSQSSEGMFNEKNIFYQVWIHGGALETGSGAVDGTNLKILDKKS